MHFPNQSFTSRCIILILHIRKQKLWSSQLSDIVRIWTQACLFPKLASRCLFNVSFPLFFHCCCPTSDHYSGSSVSQPPISQITSLPTLFNPLFHSSLETSRRLSSMLNFPGPTNLVVCLPRNSLTLFVRQSMQLYFLLVTIFNKY